MTETAENEERLQRILGEFVKVKNVRESFDQACQFGITVELSPALPSKMARLCNNNGEILLNGKADDAVLLGTLSHEMVHFHQQMRGLDPNIAISKEGAPVEFPTRDPYAAFYIQRLREAEAFSAQMEYAREYFTATGNKGPGAFLKKVRPEVFSAYVETMTATSGDRKEARKSAFLSFMAYAADYDDDLLGQLEKTIALYKKTYAASPEKSRAFFMRDRKLAVAPSTIRAFGQSIDGNFTDGLSDSELGGEKWLGSLKPETKERLDRLRSEYQGFFKNLSSPAPRKTPGGIKP